MTLKQTLDLMELNSYLDDILIAKIVDRNDYCLWIDYGFGHRAPPLDEYFREAMKTNKVIKKYLGYTVIGTEVQHKYRWKFLTRFFRNATYVIKLDIDSYREL